MDSACAPKPVLIDYLFTALSGRLQRKTVVSSSLDEAAWAKTIHLTTNVIPGWADLDEGELLLTPDLARVCRDPTDPRNRLLVFAHAHGRRLPNESFSVDPREFVASLQRRLHESGVADTAQLGLELEFFLFDDVNFDVDGMRSMFEINAGRKSGRPPSIRSGAQAHLLPPADEDGELRDLIVERLGELGIATEQHKHEAGPYQHEVVFAPCSLLAACDNFQLAKYVIAKTAREAGRVACFMPKPMPMAAGAGLHFNLSLWRAGEPILFQKASDRAELSPVGNAFVAGLKRHARSLQAVCNASDNSFARVCTFFDVENPVRHGIGTESAPLRVRPGRDQERSRVEIRFPDATCNIYLAAAALILAGIDGVQAGWIDAPQAPLLKSTTPALFTPRSPDALCANLYEAAAALFLDNDYLKKGRIIHSQVIRAYLAMLNEQIRRDFGHPTPVHYCNHFDL